MKLTLQISILLLLSNCRNEKKVRTDIASQAEKGRVVSIDSDSIYMIVKEMPILLECEKEGNRRECSDKKLLEFIFRNLKYNPRSNEDGIGSSILVTFVVEKNGEISNIEILKGKGLSNISKILQNMPKWKPGNQDGEPRRVKINLPIRIHLE